MSNFIYGIILNGKFFSNRMEIKIHGDYGNGIYSMNMDEDDFVSTLSIADIEDARKFFKKASKIKLLKGVSFHDGIIPENPVKYKQIPIKVIDPIYDEFEEVEVVSIKDKFFYFIQILYGQKSYALMDLKEAFESEKKVDISKIKDLTPEMKIAYTFLMLEKKKEEKKEPVEFITNLMKETGAVVNHIKEGNRGFEVSWTFGSNTINTFLDKNYRVIEAGFCVSGYDNTQSAQSVVNLLKDYQDQGDYIYLTRR
jgi:hypothetical protein